MAPLQAMDVTTLKAVLAELRATLLPARFEKAQQGDGQSVQLGLRSLSGRHWLELGWQAEAPRLLAMAPPPRQGEGSTLAQQLQHGLRGLALVALEQPGWERVVTLAFAERPGAAVSRRLVIELMGRHSNLFLLDGSGRVVAIGRQVRERQSRLRPIGNGDLYTPPPPLAGDPPERREPFASWQRRLQLLPQPLAVALRQSYQGVSPALARQLAEGSPEAAGPEALLRQPVDQIDAAGWQHLYGRWQQWLEVVATEQFRFQRGGPTPYNVWCDAPTLAPPGSQAQRPPTDTPINAGLARYYGQELGQRALEQARHSLQQRLQHRAEGQRRQLADQEQRLAQVDNADALQQQADALLCLPQPERDQIEAAQGLYRRARKLRRSLAAISGRLEQHRHQLAWLEASLTFLEQAETLTQIEALADECEAQEGLDRPRSGRARPAATGPAWSTGPLELLTASGLRLLVGRNHRQNEAISLRQARRGDLWFHAQECPGSHVVLKSSEAPAGEADCQAGADLAAHFSRARGNRRVPVLMVPVEQLQRLPGSEAGTVRHRGGEVRWGEPARAARLLERAANRPVDAPRSLGPEQAP